jgi:hypothetical protein
LIFGEAKTTLLINIYNRQVSYPDEIIYLALANITTCFCFPSILADVAGAFGLIAEEKYFVSTSHVFGSNTSANFWEAFRRAIPSMIPALSQRTSDLVNKHKNHLNNL